MAKQSRHASMQDAIRMSAPPKQHMLKMRNGIEYDTLQPEMQIQIFNKFMDAARARHNENMRLIAEYDLQQQDLDHYAEMHENLGRTEACAFYREMREIRRKRRACKNEVALLDPLIQFYAQNKGVFDQLKQLQGRICAAKEHLDQLNYTVKTKILDSRLEEQS